MPEIVNAKLRHNTWISFGNARAQKEWRGEALRDSITIRNMKPGKYLLDTSRDGVVLSKIDFLGRRLPWEGDRRLGIIDLEDGVLYVGSSISGIDFNKIAGGRRKATVMVGMDTKGRVIGVSLRYFEER